MSRHGCKIGNSPAGGRAGAFCPQACGEPLKFSPARGWISPFRPPVGEFRLFARFPGKINIFSMTIFLLIFNSDGFWFIFIINLCRQFFCDFWKKSFRPKWTIYKHVLDNYKKCLSVVCRRRLCPRSSLKYSQIVRYIIVS